MSNKVMYLENVKDAIDENNINMKEHLTGRTEDLKTMNKDNLVTAINELFKDVVDFKNAIADTIYSMGGIKMENPATAPIQDFINAIKSINFGFATAEDKDILEGKTAFVTSGFVEGSMKNIGNEYTKKVTYKNGNFKAGMTPGAHVTNDTEKDVAFPVIIIPQSNIVSAANITPDKIKTGYNLLGVTGNAGGGKGEAMTVTTSKSLWNYDRPKSYTYSNTATFTLPVRPVVAYVKIVAYADNKGPSASTYYLHGSEYMYVKVRQGDNFSLWCTISSDNIDACRMYFKLSDKTLSVYCYRHGGSNASRYYVARIDSTDIYY